MDYISLFFVDLPPKANGLTVKNDDGGYTILINAKLSIEGQRAAYDHEIQHINNQDFDEMYDVNILEHVRHQL